MNEWSLFLDDERFPPTSIKDDWVIARTTHAAINLIAEKGMPYRMSLDHDLGYQQATGYAFVKWLVNEDIEERLNINQIIHFYVHSQNPIGAKNMNEYYKNYINFK